ncbi:hypothetical protein Vadar_025749 [Vaccinium darrowii]|uniref:Uncharacterized protein n=1 Tax=Vaccinium darrowii TaxID=229202 RepID=A0ACB7YI71_9ERIC|nr:hypothetical protein Vadar_025749 [Vaccinium darrowii]
MCQAITQPDYPRVRRPRRMLELRTRQPVTAKQEWKAGIWVFVLAVAGSVSLHLLDMFLFCSAERALNKNKVAWSYGHWFMDFIYIYPSVVVSVCCWFCWAERDLFINGVFDRNLDPAKLLRFYLGFIVLNAVSEPIVFEIGAFKSGILACVMKTWFAGAIARMFIESRRRRPLIPLADGSRALGWYKDPMFSSPSCVPTFWVASAVDEFILTWQTHPYHPNRRHPLLHGKKSPPKNIISPANQRPSPTFSSPRDE